MTKMTYAMAIDNAIALFSQGGQIDAEDKETVERLEALRAQLAKRNSGERKATKTQRENEGLKTEVAEFLRSVTGGMQCKDIAAHFEVSGQKMSALLTQLVKAEVVEKYAEKRITYFKAVEG